MKTLMCVYVYYKKCRVDKILNFVQGELHWMKMAMQNGCKEYLSNDFSFILFL